MTKYLIGEVGQVFVDLAMRGTDDFILRPVDEVKINHQINSEE
jgi:hypothetical protein